MMALEISPNQSILGKQPTFKVNRIQRSNLGSVSFGRISDEFVKQAEFLANPKTILEIVKADPKLSQLFYKVGIPPQANMSGLKDVNEGHSSRMADLVVGIYNNLPRRFQKGVDKTLLKISAELHDTGKIGIPENILDKNGPLTPAERIIINIHPDLGYAILESKGLGKTKAGKEILSNVGGHHQTLLGTGYPLEAKCTIGTQIVSMADVYDAIKYKRSYKDANSREATLKIIKEGYVDTGKLDSNIYNALIKATEVKPRKKVLNPNFIDTLKEMFGKHKQGLTPRFIG